MRAVDLRIGNLVEYKITDALDERKEWWELNPIDVFDLQHLVEFPDDGFFRPIPLTEEWLLKMGFRATVENAGNLPCFKKDKITIARWTDNKWQVWYKSLDLVMSAQEVHQLQNLYHALTGEELTIF